MMGFGGVTALGCTIGQGLTGVSTLAVGSILTLLRDHRRLRAGGPLPEVAPRPDGARCPRERRSPNVNGTMIVFDLPCTHGHRFEGWFASGDEFEQPARVRLVRCPVCDVARGDARAVGARERAQGRRAPTPPSAPEVGRRRCPPELLAKLREAVRNTENVGRRFPEEARKIHYEEVPHRAIRGRRLGRRSEGAARRRHRLRADPADPDARRALTRDGRGPALRYNARFSRAVSSVGRAADF